MIFDGHGDIWTDVTCRRIKYGERNVFEQRHLKKFQKGNVDGGIFVIWIDPPYDNSPLERSEQIVRCIKEELIDSKNILNLVTEFKDFAVGKAESKINVVNGMEGLSQIGEDIDLINYFYDEVGVRHAMLTWNEQNALATGWPNDVEAGLTKAGVKAVRRISDLGMVMDVSHLNDKCFYEVVSNSTVPVIASHSNARAVCPAMRNLTDDMLREIANTGGIIGMNSLKDFIHEDTSKQDVEHLADHVDYIANLIGTDYIAIGYDFDDYLEAEAIASFSDQVDSPSGVGISNEAEASNLLKILKQRGYSNQDIEKIAYKNFYRVFEQTWK